MLSAFASDGPEGHLRRLKVGEGLVGQCALEKRRMLINDLPENTISIRSGLFEAVPRNVIVLPVLFEDRVKAVIELASLNLFTASHLAFLEQLTASIGIVLNSRPKLCSNSRSSWRPNCKPSRENCSRPTSSWRKRPSS
jgi:putative methionine-R-sulfoxide reductase with GAF domain